MSVYTMSKSQHRAWFILAAVTTLSATGSLARLAEAAVVNARANYTKAVGFDLFAGDDA